jgi:hypothetical protein
MNLDRAGQDSTSVTGQRASRAIIPTASRVRFEPPQFGILKNESLERRPLGPRSGMWCDDDDDDDD